MLAGVGCIVALWCLVPFFYEPAKPISMTPSIVGQASTLPDELIQEEVLTVFIHGSLHVPLVFLSPLCIFGDSFDGSWYERTIHSLRHHSITQQGGVVLSYGLHEVTELAEQESFVGPARSSGACHTIRGFNRSCQKIPHVKHRFFTFGWSGILSEKERKAAAQDLYESLYELRNMKLLAGKRVRIELYAFSHGGQVALYVPYIRKLRGDPNFIIDLLVLSAVPLYYHSAKNLLMGMFTTTINCYSPGDFAQTIDRFSSPSIPHQTLAETIPIPENSSLRFIDLAIQIGKHHPVPHCAFFDINQFEMPSRRVRRSPNYHTRHQGVHQFLNHLHPLPLVVLYPYFFEPLFSYLQTAGKAYNAIELHVEGTNNTFEGTYIFAPPGEKFSTTFTWPFSPALAASQQDLKEALREHWLPAKALCLWHETVHAIGTFWKR